MQTQNSIFISHLQPQLKPFLRLEPTRLFKAFLLLFAHNWEINNYTSYDVKGDSSYEKTSYSNS